MASEYPVNKYGLTKQAEQFALNLAKGMSQSDAYRDAYPSSKKWNNSIIWCEASRRAADPNVIARVQILMERACKKNDITAEMIVAELAKLAFFDVRKLFNGDGTPKAIHDLDDETAAAIQGIDVANVGNEAIGVGQVMKIKLADKRASLETIGRHLKMFTDRVAVGGGADAPPIRHEVTKIVKIPAKVAAVVETRAIEDNEHD